MSEVAYFLQIFKESLKTLCETANKSLTSAFKIMSNIIQSLAELLESIGFQKESSKTTRIAEFLEIIAVSANTLLERLI